jgi:uncharacterized RDD family membrane protein YckC
LFQRRYGTRQAGVDGAGETGEVTDPDPRPPRMTREELGSWLSGPGGGEAATTGYRGERLGLPPAGPGSVAGFGRRVAALFIDWFAAVGVVALILPPSRQASDVVEREFVVLAVFALAVWIGVSLSSASLGQWLLGMRVVGLDGRPIGPARALLRTLLICLVIPAAILDRDARGLHDKATRSVVVTVRPARRDEAG